MRPRVVECDACGIRVEPDDYGTPDGWVEVKAHAPWMERSEGQAEFCPHCASSVDVAAVAAMGRPWVPPKPARKTKAAE